MRRTKYTRLIVCLLGITILTTGCEQSSTSGDIIKIAPDDHTLMQDYSSFQGDNALNEAVIYLRAGEAEKAIFILEKFTTYYPNNSMGHFHLGRAYYQNNQIDKFLRHTKQAFLMDKELEREIAGPTIGKDIVGRIFVTDQKSEEKKLALKPQAWFDKNTPTIYASTEIINAPQNTQIEAELVYELSKKEEVQVNSILFNIEGSKNAVISVQKPESGWPEGLYKLKIFVNGKENTNLNFYIFR